MALHRTTGGRADELQANYKLWTPDDLCGQAWEDATLFACHFREDDRIEWTLACIDPKPLADDFAI